MKRKIIRKVKKGVSIMESPNFLDFRIENNSKEKTCYTI